MLNANQSLTTHLKSATGPTILLEDIVPFNKIKSRLEPIVGYKGKTEELDNVLTGIDILLKENKNDR